ncbi:uncharacterized protein LOC143884564 [Tasmannia lanceolata]|uniref:uncharacterized protein LOC143884564 n=1 Tax=Tasmannia lanceolata TaxID=3420 RepID=UPI004063F3ED
MSDRVSSEHMSSNAKARESMHPYQSLWMSHWMRASCIPASRDQMKEGHNTIQGQTAVQILESTKPKRLGVDEDLSLISEYKNTRRHGQEGLVVLSDVPQSAREKVTGARRIKLTNEMPMMSLKNAISLGAEAAQLDAMSLCRLSGSSVNPENLTTPFPYSRNTISEQIPIPNFKFSQKVENISSPVTDISIFNKHPSRSRIDGKSQHGDTHVRESETHLPSTAFPLPSDEIGFLSKEYHFKAGVGQSQEQQIESYKSLEKNMLPVSNPLQGSSKGSTFNSVPYRINTKGPNMRSCTCRGEENLLSSSGLVFKEQSADARVTHMECGHSNYGSYSTFLASGAKMDNRLNATSTRFPCVGHKDGILQLNSDALKGDPHFPILVGEQDGRINDFSITRLLPPDSSTPKLTPLENLNCGHHLLNKMPTCSLHDVETLRICTTVDSVEGRHGGPPKFAKTTHHLTITNKTDDILSHGEPMINESTVSTEYKGDVFHSMFSLPPFLGFYGEQGTSFQHRRNLIDSEEKEDKCVSRASFLRIQNESSAETDTMSIDVYQSRNSPSGGTPSPSRKDVWVSKRAGNSQAAVASSSKEIRISNAKTDLPDINEEPPVSFVGAISENNKELSTSLTESLDVEHLLSHVEQPECSNYGPRNDSSISLGPESSSRWVKRLRLNASDSFALGTKSSKVGDAASNRKVNELFSRIMNYSKLSSEPMLGKHLEKGAQQLDKTVMLLKNSDSSSSDSVKDRRDLSLSHSWIRRWCHSKGVAPQVRVASGVVCEPESSKAALEELQRKQFPSIAAMALMGKAVRNFRPCEFRSRGSFVVWNTERS